MAYLYNSGACMYMFWKDAFLILIFFKAADFGIGACRHLLAQSPVALFGKSYISAFSQHDPTA